MLQVRGFQLFNHKQRFRLYPMGFGVGLGLRSSSGLGPRFGV